MGPPIQERLVVKAEFINGFDGISQFGLGCWTAGSGDDDEEEDSDDGGGGGGVDGAARRGGGEKTTIKCLSGPSDSAFTTVPSSPLEVASFSVSPPAEVTAEMKDNEWPVVPWQLFSFALTMPSASWSTLTVCGTAAHPTSPLIETRVRLYPREEPPWEVLIHGADPRVHSMSADSHVQCGDDHENREYRDAFMDAPLIMDTRSNVVYRHSGVLEEFIALQKFGRAHLRISHI